MALRAVTLVLLAIGCGAQVTVPSATTTPTDATSNPATTPTSPAQQTTPTSPTTPIANPTTPTQQQQPTTPVQPTTPTSPVANVTPTHTTSIPVAASPPASNSASVVVVVTTLGRTATVTGVDPTAAASSAAAVASLAASNDDSSGSSGTPGWVIGVAVAGGVVGAVVLAYLGWLCTRNRFGPGEDDHAQPIRWPELKAAPGDAEMLNPPAARRVTGMDLGSEFGEEDSSHGSLGYSQAYHDDPRQTYCAFAHSATALTHADDPYTTNPSMTELNYPPSPVQEQGVPSSTSHRQSVGAHSMLSSYSQGQQVWPPANQRLSMASSSHPADLMRTASSGSTYAGTELGRGGTVRSVGENRILGLANPDKEELA